jgi:hypothetical protein
MSVTPLYSARMHHFGVLKDESDRYIRKIYVFQSVTVINDQHSAGQSRSADHSYSVQVSHLVQSSYLVQIIHVVQVSHE